MTRHRSTSIRRRPPSRTLRAAFLFVLCLAPARLASPHAWKLTQAAAGFTADGGYVIELAHDFDSMLAGVPPGHMQQEVFEFLAKERTPAQLTDDVEKIKTSMQRTIRVRFDGKDVPFDIEFPDQGKTRLDWDLPPGPWPGQSALLKGRVPEGASAFTFKVSAIYGPIGLRFTDDATGDLTQILEPGAESAPLALTWNPGAPVTISAATTPTLAASSAPTGEDAPSSATAKTATLGGEGSAPGALPAAPDTAPKTNAAPAPEPAAAGRASVTAGPPPSRMSIALKYLALGYQHIIPLGLDHILFVLGLFLLSRKPRPLLTQVTAFTLAHSATLALAIYGVIRLPASVVEPMIAISIACVAIENLFTNEMKPWRPAVVFLFGLLHGMGFAGVLSDLGLPRSRFITAVLTFNVGVELGQLSVIALAFLAVGWFANRPWYRRRIVIPGSLAIAAVALYWTYQRIFIGV